MRPILFAAFVLLVVSCNSNSPVVTASHDSAGHNSAGSHDHSKAADQSNEMQQAMTTMMQEMHGATATGNNDVDFATMMMAHHKGAVKMSELELAKGADAELKSFAKKVIDDQQKEIAMMQDFVAKAPKTASGNAADFQKAMNGSMMAMMNGDITTYNEVDKDYAAQMIPHHQSAVDMAKAYLEYGQEASLRTLSQNIIASQEMEIKWLKEWLTKNVK